MRRREFLAVLGGVAALVRQAQAEQQLRTIGVLGIFSLERDAVPMRGLDEGLRTGGYIEGSNLRIIRKRVPDGGYEKLLAAAAELIHAGVEVLVASGSPQVAHAGKQATSTVPIIFANGGDPVSLGLVNSLNAPGRNITGVTFSTNVVGAKRLQLFRQLLPSARNLMLLVNPNNPVTQEALPTLRDAAVQLDFKLYVFEASNDAEIENAFAELKGRSIDAVFVNVDAFFASRAKQLASLAMANRIPASFNNTLFVKSGGLMSYGDDRLASYRQVGIYVSRVLGGENPAALPVVQPTKLNLSISLTAARAIGISIPSELLAVADEVIE
jgi:ABC-type uncharacterized transport system substrate-binding protein